MPKFFINNSQIENNKIQIKGQDVNHIKNVLRAKVGDILHICNKDTSENFNCEIIRISNQEIETIIKQKDEQDTESIIQVTIFQGIPKADKMEYIIQKSVELGAYDIFPIEMKRSIVKIQENDKNKKIQRWQKISEGASKQSGRSIIPEVKDFIKINDLKELVKEYDIFLVAYEKERENTLKMEIEQLKKMSKKIAKIGILVGPEGGIDEQEVLKLRQYGCKIITLGKRILRTETVALNILSIIMYELENEK